MAALRSLAEQLGLPVPVGATDASLSAAIAGAVSSLKAKADATHLLGDERLADTTIHVKVATALDSTEALEEAAAQGPPKSKRARTRGKGNEQQQQDGDGAAAAVAAASGGQIVATLKCHATLLAQRSTFFQGVRLGGGAGLADGRSKTVTVELEDADKAASFQRLIRLCYSPSYTVEGGQALGKPELLRLLLLADRFGMSGCGVECVLALSPVQGVDEAAALFAALPESLLEDERLRGLVQQAGDAFAEGLDVAERLWTPGPALDPQDWAKSWVLDERVARLPLPALLAVLRSDKLRLLSENTAFSLAYWWVLGQPGGCAERQPLFDRLLATLRYAHMERYFLAAITQLPMVRASSLLPSIMAASHYGTSQSRGNEQTGLVLMCETALSKAALDAGETLAIPLGVVMGVPCHLEANKGKWLWGNAQGKPAYYLTIKSVFFGSSYQPQCETEKAPESGFQVAVHRSFFCGRQFGPGVEGWTQRSPSTIFASPVEYVLANEAGNLMLRLLFGRHGRNLLR